MWHIWHLNLLTLSTHSLDISECCRCTNGIYSETASSVKNWKFHRQTLKILASLNYVIFNFFEKFKIGFRLLKKKKNNWNSMMPMCSIFNSDSESELFASLRHFVRKIQGPRVSIFDTVDIHISKMVHKHHNILAISVFSHLNYPRKSWF